MPTSRPRPACAVRRGSTSSPASPTRASLTAALDRANLAWGVVRHTSEAVDSPTIRHRGTFVELTDDDGSTYRVVRAPYRFSNAASGVQGPAPRPDQHRVEVLADWLGLSETVSA